MLSTVVLIAALAWPALHGHVYLSDDLGMFHLPLRHFYANCLATGEPFNWFPGLFCGMYLQGEGQSGMYHPLHLGLYSALPLSNAFQLEFLLSYPFAFAGMFLLLRRRGLPADAAGFGGLIFTFSGFNIFHFKHMNAVAVVSHIPWLLLGADHLLRDPDRRSASRWGVAVAALTASEILLGYPQYVWFSILAEGAFGVWLLVEEPARWRRFPVWFLAKSLGILCGAVQLLPTWDSLKGSYRAEPTQDFRAFGSLPPGNLMQLLGPYLYRYRVVAPVRSLGDYRTHEFGLYNGAMVPVLLTWLIMRRGRAVGGRGLLATSAMMAAFGLVLALGDYTPLFWVTSKLPLFDLFRIPARYVMFYHLATAVLAAVALADLTALGERQPAELPPPRSLWPLALVPLIAALLAVGTKPLARLWPETLLRPFLARDATTLIGFGLVAGAALLVYHAARGRSWAILAIIVFAAADMGTYGLSYVLHDDSWPVQSLTAAHAVPEAIAGQRIVQKEVFPDDVWTMSGLSLVGGYVGLEPQRQLDYTRPSTWRIASATWSLERPQDGGGFRPIPDALARARMRTAVAVSRKPSRALETIDLATTSLVKRPLDLPPGEPGTATILMDRPGRIGVQTRADTRQLLVVSESFHKGWRARIDDQAAKVLRADGDFLGVVVPEGEHRVDLTFDPASLRWGKSLSVVGALLLLAWLAMCLRPPAEG
jgi:hypothetical protein